jgi:hypothetical protein
MAQAAARKLLKPIERDASIVKTRHEPSYPADEEANTLSPSDRYIDARLLIRRGSSRTLKSQELRTAKPAFMMRQNE